jgi:hypothetical protein
MAGASSAGRRVDVTQYHTSTTVSETFGLGRIENVESMRSGNS